MDKLRELIDNTRDNGVAATFAAHDHPEHPAMKQFPGAIRFDHETDRGDLVIRVGVEFGYCIETKLRTKPYHRSTDICHEFIWLRNPSKRFFCLNHRTGERQYIESVSAWFDTVHQYHGTEATDELSFSIRVEGRFSDQLRSHIPKNNFSPASTPSLWASLSKLASVN